MHEFFNRFGFWFCWRSIFLFSVKTELLYVWVKFIVWVETVKSLLPERFLVQHFLKPFWTPELCHYFSEPRTYVVIYSVDLPDYEFSVLLIFLLIPQVNQLILAVVVSVCSALTVCSVLRQVMFELDKSKETYKLWCQTASRQHRIPKQAAKSWLIDGYVILAEALLEHLSKLFWADVVSTMDRHFKFLLFCQRFKWVIEVFIAIEVRLIKCDLAEVLNSECQVVYHDIFGCKIIKAQGSFFVAIEVLNYSSLDCKNVLPALIYVTFDFIILMLTDVLKSNGLRHFIYLCKCLQCIKTFNHCC